MLFGNRDKFGLEIRPLEPSWERRYAPEATAWAALSVWVEGTNLCEHAPPGETHLRDAVNVPLAPLADWLFRSWAYLTFEQRAGAFQLSDDLFEVLDRWDFIPPPGVEEDDWVDQREAWWRRHFLLAGADGAILPNLALAPHDETVILQWRRPPMEPLRFLNKEGHTARARGDVEQPLADFVRYVAEWIRRDGVRTGYDWRDSEDPLRDVHYGRLRRLEIYTGRTEQDLRELLGIAEADDLAARLGIDTDPTASPVTQVLRDLPAVEPTAARGPLAALLQATGRGPSTAELERWRAVARDAAQAGATTEDAGYQAAATLRSHLGMNGEPVASVKGLLQTSGVSTESRPESFEARALTGWRRNGGAVAVLLDCPRTRVSWGRRFEWARALGHLLLDPWGGDALGAASSAFAQGVRHRRAGAFAAEFLLPQKALERATEGHLDNLGGGRFPEIMSRYGVGARTAAMHLWNRGWLTNEATRDDLIEQYAQH
jgi:hypothetical protein